MRFVIMSGRLRRRRARIDGRWVAGRVSPVVLAVLIAALAYSTPREIAISRLLPVAPALAAAMWPVLATVLLGAVCLLLMVGLTFLYTDLGTPYTGAAIVAVTLAAAYTSHVRIQREEALFRTRLVADAAQTVLLRPVPRRIQGMEIESLYLAAQEQARIGGDFYEVADTPYGVRLLIGDVRGKGLSAVGAAAAVIGSFREAAYEEPDLRELIHRLEASIARHCSSYPGPDQPERFATAVIAEFPRGGGRLRLLNCGHPPPILVHAGRVEVLEPSAVSAPLAFSDLVGDAYAVDTHRFTAGDQLLLYTDGVTETRDRAGTFFPLPEWMSGQSPAAPRELLDRLHRDLVRHSGARLEDDIAALAVHARHVAAGGAP